MEFTLGTGQLRGTYDLGAVPREDRQFWKVYLVPVREAHVDVFFSPCDGYSRSEEMAQVEIGGDGAFQFAWLATGRYVFWVTGRDDEIVVARCFDVPDGARVDLGTVRRGLVVDATVRCGLGNQHGMWVRMEDPGNDEGVFVRTVAVHEGRIELKGSHPAGTGCSHSASFT